MEVAVSTSLGLSSTWSLDDSQKSGCELTLELLRPPEVNEETMSFPKLSRHHSRKMDDIQHF